MAIALECHSSSLRVRADPQDTHHHHDHHRQHQTRHYQSHWWHWRHNKHTAQEEQPQHHQQQPKPKQRRVHHHHQNRQLTAEALAPTPSALSKRLSSATACHDDPHSVQARRKRIVLHAIFKC